MTKDEVLWSKIKFSLWLVVFVAGVLICICKFIVHVPVEDSSDLIQSINNSEQVFSLQNEYSQKARGIWEEIDSLDFNTHQVQKMDEIKEDIQQLQDIYHQNNSNSKYLFGVFLARSLKLRFDAEEELNSIINNNKLIEKDLEECKANL